MINFQLEECPTKQDKLNKPGVESGLPPIRHNWKRRKHGIDHSPLSPGRWSSDKVILHRPHQLSALTPRAILTANKGRTRQSNDGPMSATGGYAKTLAEDREGPF